MIILLIAVIIILIIISIYTNYNKYNEYDYTTIKGEEGEEQVKYVIGETNAEYDYYVINDLRITTPKGHNAQIDHIVINTNGIFVIETKNYSGEIYGDDYAQEWLQVNYGGYNNYFYSPVKQNATHIKRICEYIPDYLPIYSVIVFVNDNIDNINSIHVCNLLELEDIINYPNERQLTHEEIIKTYNTLQLHNQK